MIIVFEILFLHWCYRCCWWCWCSLCSGWLWSDACVRSTRCVAMTTEHRSRQGRRPWAPIALVPPAFPEHLPCFTRHRSATSSTRRPPGRTTVVPAYRVPWPSTADLTPARGRTCLGSRFHRATDRSDRHVVNWATIAANYTQL